MPFNCLYTTPEGPGSILSSQSWNISNNRVILRFKLFERVTRSSENKPSIVTVNPNTHIGTSNNFQLSTALVIEADFILIT